MQKQIKILLTILTVLILAVSCNPNDPTKTKEQMLQQKWIDAYNSVYDITDKKVVNSYLNKTSYAIEIIEISWNADNKSGIIYGKYTENNNNPHFVGKYYAMSFKGLTDAALSISGAGKQLPDKTFDSSAETLKEAKTKFTAENGYFDYYSDCTVVK